MKHTLEHAIDPRLCACYVITECVICGKALVHPVHLDTCSPECFRKLLELQRANPRKGETP